MALDNKVIPVSWLRTQFDYDPLTGAITNSTARKGAKAGAEPCYPIARGYLALKVTYEGVRYTFMAHRLAWALHKGKHPEAEVDHKNHDRQGNWVKNLRPATRVQNIVSRAIPPRDLPKGVRLVAKSKKKPYHVYIAAAGKSRFIGSFADVKSAASAYDTAAVATYGVFARTNKKHGRRFDVRSPVLPAQVVVLSQPGQRHTSSSDVAVLVGL